MYTSNKIAEIVFDKIDILEKEKQFRDALQYFSVAVTLGVADDKIYNRMMLACVAIDPINGPCHALNIYLTAYYNKLEIKEAYKTIEEIIEKVTKYVSIIIDEEALKIPDFLLYQVKEKMEQFNPSISLLLVISYAERNKKSEAVACLREAVSKELCSLDTARDLARTAGIEFEFTESSSSDSSRRSPSPRGGNY